MVVKVVFPGFLICSTAVLPTAFYFLLGERRWYPGLSMALVFTVTIHLVFAKDLQIRLP